MSAKEEYNKQRESENSEQLPWKYEVHVHIVESVQNRQTFKKIKLHMFDSLLISILV